MADDIRTDILTREQWIQRCAFNAEDAFYTPPEQFLFRHYDESSSSDSLLICQRHGPGLERYDVINAIGEYFGVYDTRTVTYYIKSGTWVMKEDPTFFLCREITALEHQLQQKKQQLEALQHHDRPTQRPT
jgi:hypothetical protein